MLMFFGVLYSGLSAKPAPVGDGVLDLNLNGSVVEQPARAQLVGRRGGNRSANIACATSSRRSTRPRTTAG